MGKLNKIAVVAVMPAALLVAGLVMLWGGSAKTSAAANQMTVSAPANVAVGANFLATIAVTSAAGGAYDTYQMELSWDNPDPGTGLLYVGTTNSHLATGVGFNNCAGYIHPAITPTGDDDSVATNCNRPAGTSTFVGDVEQIELKCLSTGVFTLHLVDLDEDSIFGTTTIVAGSPFETDLTDTIVNCGGAAPPTLTPTRTPGTPTVTRTPTRTATPTATSTPLPACRFDDDLGRDTHLAVELDGRWRFTGPDDFDMAGAGARVVIRGGRLILLARNGPIIVSGFGMCPTGPGRATMVDFRRFAVLRIIDLG